MIAALALDASVLVKLFLQEQDSAAARALLRGGFSIVGPEALRVEVSSAIARRFRLGALTRSEAERALQDTRRYLARGVKLSPDIGVLPRAEEIALDIKHALKDCLYVAVAERENCDLVTADATLIARASPQFPFVRAL